MNVPPWLFVIWITYTGCISGFAIGAYLETK